MIYDIPKTPIPKPTPAGIKIEKSKLATELTYSSYNPNVDKITALSTPGTIDEPATATPKNTDCNRFGSVTCGNALPFTVNSKVPNKAAAATCI